MAGKVEDKEKLLKLQDLDNTLEEGAEQFNDNPIAQEIGGLRQKKAELKSKRDQVDQVFVKSRKQIEDVSANDSQLASQQEKIQAEIDSVAGDYRKVESLTQKLNEVSSQRKNIDSKLETLEANFNKIKELQSRIDAGIEKLSMQEDELRQKLEASNVQLKLQMDEAQSQKAQLEPTISADALEAYKKARSIVGKITVAKNENDSCSACRSKFSQANASKVAQQGAIAVCPNCMRILV